jgi:hypothetical protein
MYPDHNTCMEKNTVDDNLLLPFLNNDADEVEDVIAYVEKCLPDIICNQTLTLCRTFFRSEADVQHFLRTTASNVVEGLISELTISEVVGTIFAYGNNPNDLQETIIRPFRGHERLHRKCVLLCNKLHEMLFSLDPPDKHTFLQFWSNGIFEGRCFIKFVSAGSRRQASSGIRPGSMVLKFGLCVGNIYSTHSRRKQGKECFQGPKCAHTIDDHRVTQGKLPHATQGYYLWKYEPIAD